MNDRENDTDKNEKITFISSIPIFQNLLCLCSDIVAALCYSDSSAAVV